MQTWQLVNLYFFNSSTGNRVDRWLVFDEKDVEICSKDTQREAVLNGLMCAKLRGVAVQIVGDKPSCQEILDNSDHHSIVTNLRKHAGKLHGPQHDTARAAAKAIERFASAANNVVRSVDNWKKVQPVNSQIQQDVDVLRSVLVAAPMTESRKE
jgi:hypothetical protein